MTVNGKEITVHQINYELARYTGTNDADPMRDTRQVINDMVDRQLLVQKALAAKMDREPRFMMALEKARSMVLAQAYLEPLVSSIPEPGDKEVQEFFMSHPELFMSRRVYQIEEVRAGPQVAYEEIAKRVAKTVSDLKEMVNWLQEEGAQPTFGVAVEPAERLPFEILPALAKLDVGGTDVFKIPQGSWILHIVGIQNSPMSLDAAAPYIRRYLVNEQRKELVSKELKRLRGAAKISYLGNFAPFSEPSPGPSISDGTTVDASFVANQSAATRLLVDVY